MYRLAYVEARSPAPPFGDRASKPRFRIEGFSSPGAALERAREIIGVPTISAVELHSLSGEVIFDEDELVVALGMPMPSCVGTP